MYRTGNGPAWAKPYLYSSQTQIFLGQGPNLADFFFNKSKPGPNPNSIGSASYISFSTIGCRKSTHESSDSFTTMKLSTLFALVMAALVSTLVHALSIESIGNSLETGTAQVCVQTDVAIYDLQLAYKQLT